MSDKRLRSPYFEVLSDAKNALGGAVPLLLASLLTASLLEGTGLMLLMPLLARIGIGDAAAGENPILKLVDPVLETLHVPFEIGPLMAIVVFVLLLQVLVTFAAKCFVARCTTRYTAYWRDRLFAAVIGADWTFLMRTKAEAQVNQIVGESSRVSAAFNLLLQMLNSLFFVIVYAAIALMATWQVVTLLLAFGLGVYLLTRPIARRGRRVGEQVTEVSQALMQRTQQFLLSAKLVKATATEDAATDLFSGSVEDYRKVYLEAGILPALIQLIYMASGYIVIGLGVWFALTQLTVDAVSVVVAIYVFLRLYVQLTNFQQLRQGFLLAAPALPPLKREYEEALQQAEQPGTGIDLGSDGAAAVAVSHLDVAYEGARALHDISLELPAGEILGLTGGSGAGKSTLVDAVVGLVPPAAGTVAIDGTPIRDLDPRAWRRQIGYVAQETLLLNGTIAENIAWGQPHANRADVEAAARLANADEFITRMPDGYDTVIGGRSVRMSGGQRQRIGLARALLGRKRLVILDEATSALDSESEAQILAAVENLRGRVTLIMVAHRLSTLRMANHIAVLDRGDLVEVGRFDELINQNGTFGRLWAMQSTSPERLPARDTEETDA